MKQFIPRSVKQAIKALFPGSQQPSAPVELSPFERNNARLMELRGIHTGERAFLIGNGPSLTTTDLSRLTNEITFASNKIYLAFEETDWRPTYLTVTDTKVAENNRDKLRTLPFKKVFGHGVRQYFDDGDDIIYCNPPQQNPRDWNPVDGVSTGHSVIYWDLELAYWMGIREVYVIGIDFSFDVQSKRSGEQAMGNEVLVAGNEVNHFHPDYRPKGETWTMPKLDEQRQEFIFAREKFEADGGKIFNASRKTKLDVWERVCFDDLF